MDDNYKGGRFEMYLADKMVLGITHHLILKSPQHLYHLIPVLNLLCRFEMAAIHMIIDFVTKFTSLDLTRA